MCWVGSKQIQTMAHGLIHLTPRPKNHIKILVPQLIIEQLYIIQVAILCTQQ